MNGLSQWAVSRLRPVARVVAVANQKGGVAKTTTVHSLGFAWAESGHRVLLVDLDPQACLTYSTGLDPNTLPASLHDEYDLILIDCPPSLGILAINGLCAADEVVIPLQCETLCNRGVGQLLEMIDDVRMFANADLKVRGIINTLYDDRTSHGRGVLADVKERYGLEVLDPPVRKSVRFAEAPEFGRCILQHAPLSAGAEAYRALARELEADRCLVG
jgi:chromosome partitioning protein